MAPTASSSAGDPQRYAAGFVQRREWMLYKIRDDHYPFNLKMVFDLDRFDPFLFQKTLDLLVKKHEVLRTTLRVVGGSLQQEIHRPERFPVRYTFHDLAGEAPAAQEAFIEKSMGIQLGTPFNFEYGPLFRVFVFRKSPADFRVAVVLHHVVFDLYSGHIFKKDALQIIGMLLEGKERELPADPLQYRTYAAFENELLDTEAGASYRTYWRTQLAWNIPRLGIIDEDKWEAHRERLLAKTEEVVARLQRLPFYDPRFVASVIRRYQYNHGGSLHYAYADATFQNLIDFRRSSNSSLHALFITSFLFALHKLSGQKLFAFDVPASRRTNDGYQSVIGWLAAGGVCFFELSERKTAAGFLDYVDTQLYRLARHCVYPFEALGHEGELPAGSTMPVLFVLTEAGGNAGHDPQNPGVLAHKRAGATSYQDVDLFITVFNNASTIQVGYNHSLLPPAVIENVIAEQERSLNEIIREVVRQQPVLP